MKSEKRKITLLISSVGRRVELLQMLKAQFDSLDLPHVHFIGLDADKRAPALDYVDQSIVIPKVNSSDWSIEIRTILKENQVDVIIPLNDGELAKWPILCSGLDVLYLGADRESAEMFLDKRMTTHWFESNEIKSPPLINETSLRQNFKVVKRPRFGSRSQGVEIISSDDTRIKKWLKDEQMVITSFVEGDEFTIDALIDKSEKSSIIVVRKRELIRDGESVYGSVSNEGRVIGESRKVIAYLKGMYGPISLQCIKDKEGIVWFTEINTRLAGGFVLSMAAGVNLAEWIMSEISGNPFPVTEINPTMKMRRYYQSQFRAD